MMCTAGQEGAVLGSVAIAGMVDAMRTIAVVNAVITERFFMLVTLAPPLDTRIYMGL